ncbi:hypothetical protein C2E23DRAFT_807466 [Lenzites betulinus]|nr:hypothetical protein C2E23DRAFT_807466 [Lenzites betulinus]
MDHMPSRPPKLPYSHAQARPTASTALWGHLLRKTGSQMPPSSTTSTTTLGKSTPSIAPLDKAGASTRILLHDTQAHLERFTDRVTELTAGVGDAKRELFVVQKLYQDDHEIVLDRLTGLTNRCQTELQKRIGTPAQSSEVREVAKDMSHFFSRLDALDKKIDSLNSLNQTQCHALQTIQEQQGQLLTALLPILPLLQSMPLHVDNARDRVKDSITELRQEISTRDVTAAHTCCSHGHVSHGSGRSRAHSSSSAVSRDHKGTPSARKKRRIEAILDDSQVIYTKTTDVCPDVCAGNTQTTSDHPSVDRTLANAPSLEVPPGTPFPRSDSRRSPNTAGSILRAPDVVATPRTRSSVVGSLRSTTGASFTPSGVARRSSRRSSGSAPAHLTTLSGSPALNRLGIAVQSPSHPASVVSASPSLLDPSAVSLSASKYTTRLSRMPSTPVTPANGGRQPNITAPGSFKMSLRSTPVAASAHTPSMPPPVSHSKPLSIKDLRAMSVDDQQVSLRAE